MDDTKTAGGSAGQIDKKILSKIKIPRKFEIFVEEFDEEKGWRPVASANIPGIPNGNPVITVDSPADMQSKINMYKSMEQRFKIVREIDPPSLDTIRRLAVEQGIDIETGEPITGSAGIKTGETAAGTDEKRFCTQASPAQQPAQKTVSVSRLLKPKPKIVTIGDMQLKYDGDKIYQKQWIRLNASESRNFRVVSDSSNKIVSMTGKHIEALKWVLVEEAEYVEDMEDNSAEKLLNA